MMFEKLEAELLNPIHAAEREFSQLEQELISVPKNSQNRSVKQIVGHMIDSVSNNTHRMIHLQYADTPLVFPNYATYGNNDRWIAIQNYQDEDWNNLVQLWKYTHLHFLHVVKNIDQSKLKNQWKADEDEFITLEEMLLDFPRHFHLHLSEIQEIIHS